MVTYTQDQLDRYFRHIGYSPKDAEDDLGRLAMLQLRHMARVPFESLTLHYSQHHRLSLDLEDLFEKIVDKGRGGYCMEVNTFFGAVLRSLGYTLINVGGRVKAGDREYKGWNHMVNIVTINNTRYLVDVGFGSHGSVNPVPLEHNYIFTTVSPARGKLEYKSLSQHTDPTNQRIWVYSTQENPSAPWKEMYCFAADTEFFPADFEVMNLSTMTSPQSFFVQTVMCMWLLLNDNNNDDDKQEQPIGLLILHKDYVKRRIGDKSEIIEQFESEEQRVKALQKYFGIVLTRKEKEAIRGLPSELKTRCGHC
ncbi:hypothetical protein NEUTE1DRAFT_124490 [Neurospora tetrasperma FGSC 2508]|uniref:Uncharacterized protein n=1 Tax=Neurospora tetrasperma (strain FGSC 2508 / ATCC MYA-4615 / P0657) TaxID=510951 RepID=F8MWQ4_NEUT8|nr:uncharacterized protein NEUTE1DRAFT_124490 [Neurospora tetrasperma FGSC 2508]EGO54175.1 hypothetical protein NEUTE1DRAFT_124490 [Neurospora tetrasperma FGSC 2508]EGZ68396.1 cysteine proteinase [Neurospora tetrasperma FGSC 2509]